MTIHIGLHEGEPPTGVVVGDDAVPVPFAGWLELMHAIAGVALAPTSAVPVGSADLEMDQRQEVIP